MRDKAKEEELRKGGDPKYAHLNMDLHVFIEVFDPRVKLMLLWPMLWKKSRSS